MIEKVKNMYYPNPSSHKQKNPRMLGFLLNKYSNIY